MALNTITIAKFSFGDLDFKILSKSSEKNQQNRVKIDLFEDPKSPNTEFRILGGGARVIYDESKGQHGALLTAMCPAVAEKVDWLGSAWQVESRDNEYTFRHVVTAFAVCAAMKGGKQIPPEVYKVVSKTSDASSRPSQKVFLPDGFILVGGGAKTEPTTGAGQFLVKSCPIFEEGRMGWQAASKDHFVPDPSSITAFAIGLTKEFLDLSKVEITRNGPTNSILQSHPRAAATIEGYVIGGGAEDNFGGDGNMLTGSFPDESDRRLWQVEGKDHGNADPAVISAFAIGIMQKDCVCAKPNPGSE